MPHRISSTRPPGLAQIRVHERIARLRTDKFSPTVMILSWLGFLLLHFICFFYFATAGWCYWKLPKTRLDAWLSMLYIGMETKYAYIVALVHASVAAVHGIFIIWMIGWSCWKGDVVFAVYNVIKLPVRVDKVGDDWPALSPIKEGIFWFYRAVFTRDGFLGVDGPNFDFVLLFREIIETALQTNQAYRMSQLLPRKELNRWYVGLLVLNCWTIVLVHSVFHGHASRRRLLALICDCVLDLFTSVGVTTLLVAIYIPDFDFDTYGFPYLKWYEDVWRVHAMSEFQMIFVSSWGDLIMRFIFAMSMLGNLNNMKKLIRARPTRRVKRGVKSRQRATVVAPFHASLVNVKKTFLVLDGVDPESLRYWVGKATEIGFFVWGLAILILHLHAESISPLQQCKMQAKPWFTSQPSCSLLELNCYKSGFSGVNSEVAAEWSTFDPTTVVRVVIRHCDNLELPSTLTNFSQLKEFKIYNSTITNWEARAGITQTYHPMLTTLFLIRVNMSNGELPLGLQSDDFPLALEDIEFCVTNLRSLPEDIDTKWPQYASIYLEAGEFEEVPPSLVRLAPYDLSLSMNPISVLPKQLFESDSVAFLSFGGTLISELPKDVAELSSSLYDVNLSDTNVSFFWSWIDPLAADAANTPPITAANTPYCLEVLRIFEGEQANFSVSPYLLDDNVTLSVLVDASPINWATLNSTVSCKPEDSTWYPLFFEDEYTSPSPHRFDYVYLSLCWFSFWWFVIFGVHTVTCVYYAIYTKFYWNFDATLFSYLLESNEIGMPRKNFCTIAGVFMVLAAIHGTCALLMIIASIRHRELSFSLRKKCLSRRGSTKSEDNTSWSDQARYLRLILQLYQKIAGRRGLLGVDGRYFHAVLIFRELLEMALQTVQAIRMSQFLAHTLLNRFFVCLLAINCWSSVLVYSRWFWQNEARRRFAAIVCDCVLNLMTTVGVSTILALDNLDRFNVGDSGFNFDVLNDDDWQAEFYNEAQMLIVVSWLDLMSRIVFSLGLASSAADMKDLLHCIHINRVAEMTSPSVDLIRNAVSVSPLSSSHPPRATQDVNTKEKYSRLKRRKPSYEQTGLVTRGGRTLLQLVHVLFAVWGFFILFLHAYATTQKPLLECTPKVHPMAGALPSCFAVNFDCHRLGIAGSSAQVQEEWVKFNHKTTTKVRILHCSELEIPQIFQDFRRLQVIEIYNSTIVKWDTSAAVTNTHHPKLRTITIVRVNMTNSELPAGLQSYDFPLRLGQIQFCETNLQSLPSDLDLKWQAESGIYVENSHLTDVPPALIRLKPSYLFLSGNPISDLPPELFEGSIASITLGHLHLQQLPEFVKPASTDIYYLDVTNTEISFFWSWIDPFIERATGTMLYAGGSKYCSDLENIFAGTASTFNASFKHEYSSILMNASKENWDILHQAIDCTPAPWTTSFNLKLWDQFAMWWVYWNLSGTSLSVWLYLYKLGLGTDNERTIATFHGVIAAVHFLYLVWMISWSIRKGRLNLANYNVVSYSSTSLRHSGGRVNQYARSIYRAVFSRNGLFGVNGPYFDLILFVREIVETTLQTQQAYRMSLLLPRTQLNRGYVGLLVLNCWSTVLVHSIFHKSPINRRFYTIVCDCVLDFVTSVGVSTVLLFIYSRDFDFKRNEFPLYKWYEDIWVVHAISEFQLLLVPTWGDLVMRMIFSLSMLSNMNNMKMFLTARRGPKMTSNSVVHNRITAIVPQKSSLSPIKSRYKRRCHFLLTMESRLTQVLFFMWGMTVLVLHLYAESISGLPQCQMQVKPWFNTQPSCSLLVLDCYASNFTGTTKEITDEWNNFDPYTLACVAIRHCPSLEVPPILTQFRGLKVLKFYNSTIKTWDESAGISETHHPNLIMLFLVRVNMTDGVLPPGLQGHELPRSLSDIEFCVTNLRTLPDDFALKWPQFAIMYFEACNFTEVPPSLARLAPYDLSLAVNPISRTKISELPPGVTGVSRSLKLRVDNTNVSFFYDWIDPIIETADASQSSVPTIVATNAPYCLELQQIYDRKQVKLLVTMLDNPKYFLIRLRRTGQD
ncbi:hypothetical protein PHMEG_0008331 [Phytophthora megakarya]|uniref:Uncharacterized protein n=1 Tax=Phytophthora megakarya TaxID=4795 RepID=A0A225WLG2_9STRA|nr:hypothetical protein PHMEG_0008331 [Phytophthora megakarya]